MIEYAAKREMERSSSEQICLCKTYTIMSKQVFVVESKGYFIDLLLWVSSREVIKGNWEGVQGQLTAAGCEKHLAILES